LIAAETTLKGRRMTAPLRTKNHFPTGARQAHAGAMASASHPAAPTAKLSVSGGTEHFIFSPQPICHPRPMNLRKFKADFRVTGEVGFVACVTLESAK
jgi:hypothetical protein